MRKSKYKSAIEEMLMCLVTDCPVENCEGCREDREQAIAIGREALGLPMPRAWEIPFRDPAPDGGREPVLAQSMREQVRTAEQGDPPPMILQARYLIQQAERFVDEVETSAVKTDLRLALRLIDAMIETYPELTRPG